VHAGERGVVIDAVVDQHVLAERACDHARGGIEDPVDRALKVQRSHRVLDLLTQEPAVEAAHPGAAVGGDDERRENMQIGLDLTQGRGRGEDLADRAGEIAA
jgi:hypothetical protein